jgi:hypothetical protein
MVTLVQPTYFDTADYIAPKYRNSADCLNTKSTQGRNATPLKIFEAVRYTLGSIIELDPASDEIINNGVGADRIFTLEDDGLQQDWVADTLFLNAPGTTVTGGTYAERLYWLEQMELPSKQRSAKPKDVKVVSAAKWYRKLYQEWLNGNVKSAIALHYRGGSIGGLGVDILKLPLCITAAGASSEIINGSGRLSFEIIEEGERKSETTNTQSSAFTLFFDDNDCINRFKESFSQFGVVKI